MAGIKRKTNSSSNNQIGGTKKQKREPVSLPKTNSTAASLETATDSEPIVDSDTTEHSGDDDGVSWPSDNDEEMQEIEDEAEPIQPRDKKPTTSSKPTDATTTTNGAGSELHVGSTFQLSLIVARLVEGGTCQTKSRSPGTESHKAQR
ncbi:MAG: hypothetical protein Q9224_000898 [Gallowayella concinna]